MIGLRDCTFSFFMPLHNVVLAFRLYFVSIYSYDFGSMGLSLFRFFCMECAKPLSIMAVPHIQGRPKRGIMRFMTTQHPYATNMRKKDSINSNIGRPILVKKQLGEIDVSWGVNVGLGCWPVDFPNRPSIRICTMGDSKFHNLTTSHRYHQWQSRFERKKNNRDTEW